MLVIAVRILEGMFILGVLGCAMVLVLTTIDDIRVLLGIGESKPSIPPMGSHADHPENRTNAHPTNAERVAPSFPLPHR